MSDFYTSPNHAGYAADKAAKGQGFSGPPEYHNFAMSASFHHFDILVFHSSVTNAKL
jgi:hypothetical protein